MDIGEKIRYRRKELGMSADELAELLGKDRTTIFRYERGAIKDMPITILEPLCRALRVQPSYFLLDDNVEEQKVKEIGDPLEELIAEFGEAEALSFNGELMDISDETKEFLISALKNIKDLAKKYTNTDKEKDAED